MRATALEFRSRVAVIVVIITLGFWSPSTRWFEIGRTPLQGLWRSR